MSTSDEGKVRSADRTSLKPRWKPAMAVLGSLFLLALVALAIPQYRDIILQVSCDRVERDFGGGPGGRPSPDAQCDSGFVAVGFHVQTGEYINQAWLDCARMVDGAETSRCEPGERLAAGRPCESALSHQIERRRHAANGSRYARADACVVDWCIYLG